MKIPAGTLFMLSEGSYSDYGDLALARAEKDMDPIAIANKYLDKYPEQRKGYDFKSEQFVKWLLVDSGFATEVDYSGWHLTDYGEFNPETWGEKEAE